MVWLDLFRGVLTSAELQDKEKEEEIKLLHSSMAFVSL